MLKRSRRPTASEELLQLTRMSPVADTFKWNASRRPPGPPKRNDFGALLYRFSTAQDSRCSKLLILLAFPPCFDDLIDPIDPLRILRGCGTHKGTPRIEGF